MSALSARLSWLALAGGFALAAGSLGPVHNAARAGDWPQILGPRRNGVAEGETLAVSWPESGPRTVWQYPLGAGYAGPAVVGSQVIVFHRVGDVERVEALDADSGRSRWRADFPAVYRGGIDADIGPRCVPLVHRDHVYVFGAAGDLHCVSLADGRKRWSRSAYADLGGDEGYFGAGSTPLVVDDKLLVNVGGRGGAGLAAFALANGKTLWKATDERASYSSPTVTTFNGQQHVIFVTRLNTVSVDPANGQVRFRFPFGKRGPTVNAATPLVMGDRLFVTASYGVGCRMARLGDDAATTIWSGDELMSSQYVTSVHRDGFLYGIHGREDIGVAQLRCLDVADGKVRWSVPDYGMAHVILSDDKLLMVKTDGQLVLARANPGKYEPLATTRILEGTTRTLPALANGRLYVRSAAQARSQLKCLLVGKSQAKREP